MTRTSLTGDQFRDIIFQSQKHLSERKKEVDALNVFPVPDGDTGTNMYLTLSSAADSLRGKSGLTLSEASEIASLGALMGARGNSGVILSQIFRGIARSFAGKECANPKDLALALDEAVLTAYKAVMKPVEGTILTVLRGMKDASQVASVSDEATIGDVLQECVAKGEEVLEKTPDMLPALKQAGVVDAGGKGLLYIMEGALAWYLGDEDFSVDYTLEKDDKPIFAPQVSEEEILSIENPYDTQLLIAGKDLPLSKLRNELMELGDSLLVVGSGNVVRVHIHTGTPEKVIGLCRDYGQLSQVTIDNMIEQSKQALTESTLQKAVNSFDIQLQAPQLPQVPVKDIGIISVATGDGLKDIMRSLGCDLVMDGGITMNPSTSDLVEAVKSVKAKKVIFLPNNGNIFLAAKQAKKLTGRNMYIIPSKTVPQGISALLSLNLNEDMKSNLKRAGRAVRSVKTGEVTFAARNGKFGKHMMKEGDIIGLVDGRVEAVGQSPEEVLKKTVKSMMGKNDAVVTVYCGEDVEDSVAEMLPGFLQEAIGESNEIEVHRGGQPLYYYIVSVE
ncbi:MAG TPA: DAK2 domain-containing protein [Firmicutes bacterium]|jgi:DAK2 domain fusion protein YloV|nr:DAK2 domain-containing protein [Bacillota bacterium]